MESHHVAPSYWDDRSPTTGLAADPLPSGPVDVAVVGAGVFGLLTAHRLSAHGLDVAVVEKGDVGDGVTGRSTAKVTALHGASYTRIRRAAGTEAATAYAAANIWGVTEIAALADDLDCDWFDADAVTYGNGAGADVVAEEGAAARAAGLPVSVSRNTDVGLARPAAIALTLAAQGMLDPRRFCQGIAGRLRRLGTTVTTQCRVVRVDGDVLHTTAGPMTARNIVLATHLPLLDRGGQFATSTPSRSYVVAGTVDGRLPSAMLFGLDGDGVSSVRAASPAGGDVLVGGTRRAAREPTDHVRALELWGAENVGLRSVSHRWTAHDFVPALGIPSVGPIPATRIPVYTGSGFAKWGFSNAAAAARTIEHLVVGRDHPWPELASGPRFSIPAAVDVTRRNLEVAKDYLGDRLGARPAVDPAQIGSGQGVVGRLHDRTVGACRTTEGALVLVDPRCTHRGCLVRWNDLDATWDCPCHGSRFSAEGTVIAGPATGDLRRLDEEVPGG